MNIHKTWDADKFFRLKDEAKVIAYFLERYILPLANLYADNLIKAMKKAETRILATEELTSLSLSVTSYTLGYKDEYVALCTKFLKTVHLPLVKNVIGIGGAGVLKTIERRTIKEFKKNITGALQRTPLDVRRAVKELQGNLSMANRTLKKAKESGMLQDKFVKLQAELKDKIRKNSPDYYKMTEKGEFIRYRDGKLVRIDTYSQMATRTTLLNVERDAVEIKDAVKQRRVAEIYLRDARSVSTDERKSCKHAMSRRFYGKSLVAYDRSAAKLFGIPTIEELRSRGTFGPNCRHSLKSLENAYYNRIDQLLYLAEHEVA